MPTPPNPNDLIVVQANDIETIGLDLASELPVTWLNEQLKEAEADAEAPGRFSGRLSRSGKADIVVRGKLSASVRLPCARCLAPTTSVVAAELSLLLRPRKPVDRRAAAAHAPPKHAPPKPTKNRTPEYEFSSEEADLDEYDGERVVLDGFIREAILLELPSFPVCPEGCVAPSTDGDAAGDEPSLAAKHTPLLRSQPDPRPSEPRRGPMDAAPTEPTHKPFEVLRHLLTEKPLPSDELQGNSARPSAREVRRAARTLQREKPKIRSSMTGRKKS